VIEKEIAQALALQVNLLNLDKMFHEKLPSFSAALELINHISPVVLRDMQGTFIGARMGRPEKAKMRELKGSPQVLFPVGPEGGKMRSFNAALEAGKVTADFPSYECKKCSRDTIYPVCESCRQPTFPDAAGQGSSSRSIAIKHYFDAALQTLEFSTYPDIIKGVKGTSNKDHTPERLEKGILRAKHGIYVNKDGTTRYDISEVPCTHFKPKEVGTAVHVLKELGYKIDIHGKDLTDAEQTVELFPQDIILPGCRESPDEAADVLLMRVAQFVDEMLAKLYRLPAFYNISSLENLAGQLVIGLAPHISAGIVGRIIGFSQTQGCFAHPMWHAALRRD
jgi:DNA polymerase II large subunit